VRTRVLARPAGHHRHVTYTATAALPYVDVARAVSGLRGQLRVLAQRDGAVPDWAALCVGRPAEVIGLHGVVWHEWSAAIDPREADSRSA
jgi:hypothetical protein